MLSGTEGAETLTANQIAPFGGKISRNNGQKWKLTQTTEINQIWCKQVKWSIRWSHDCFTCKQSLEHVAIGYVLISLFK